MFAVSGPIAKEIGMNSYYQALTPVGNPANASLSRVGALIGINLGGWEPNVNGIQRIGAHLWGLTIAESENSPYEGMNVDAGYGADESVLFNFAGHIKVLGACVNEVKTATSLFELQNGTPEGLVEALKASKESRNALVIFTPDTARVWQEEYGFETVQELQDYLYDNATRTREDWGSQYWFYMTSQIAKVTPAGSRMINQDHLDAPPDALVPQIVMGPEAIKIIVTGGLGTQWGYGGYLFGSQTSIDKWR